MKTGEKIAAQMGWICCPILALYLAGKKGIVRFQFIFVIPVSSTYVDMQKVVRVLERHSTRQLVCLIIYVFCKSCKPEIVFIFIFVTKTISDSGSQLLQ